MIALSMTLCIRTYEKCWSIAWPGYSTREFVNTKLLPAWWARRARFGWGLPRMIREKPGAKGTGRLRSSLNAERSKFPVQQDTLSWCRSSPNVPSVRDNQSDSKHVVHSSRSSDQPLPFNPTRMQSWLPPYSHKCKTGDESCRTQRFPVARLNGDQQQNMGRVIQREK